MPPTLGGELHFPWQKPQTEILTGSQPPPRPEANERLILFYHLSFGLRAVLVKHNARRQGASIVPHPVAGKKEAKQLVLFAGSGQSQEQNAGVLNKSPYKCFGLRNYEL